MAPPAQPLRVRRAVPEDAAALCAVSLTAISRTARSHYTEEQLAEWARPRTVETHRRMIADTVTWVAVAGPEIAGFASIVLVPHTGLQPGEVDQLYVHPAHGGRGAAGLLLQAVERTAGEAGIAELVTHASWRAAPVFARFGYRQEAVETVERDGQVLTRARMRKPLVPRSA